MRHSRWQSYRPGALEVWDADPAAASASEAETSLGKIALQWKGSIFLGSFVAAVIAYVALLLVTPIFAAKTHVLLGTGHAPVINIPNVVPEPTANIGFTESALIVMKSANVLRAVVEELELDKLEEFNPALRDPGLGDRAMSLLRGMLGSGGDTSQPSGTASYQPHFADDPLAGTLRGLRSAVSVRVLGESQVAEISAQSENPRLAALISDTIAEKYIARDLEAKLQAGGQATLWLEERAVELRGNLEKAEQRVAEFRSGIVNSGEDLVEDLELRLAELNTQISALSADRSDLIARRDEIARLFTDGNFIAVTEALDVPAVTGLFEKYSELDARVIDLQAKFGEHPSVTEAIAARDFVGRQLSQQIEQALSGLNVRVNITAERLAGLNAAVQSTRRELAKLRENELTLVGLEREAEASRDVYNRFSLRLKEARERSLFQTPEALIVSYAEVPIAPAFPQKTKLAAIAAVGGGLLVLAFIVLGGRHHARIDDPRQIAALTGVSAVHQIPEIRGVHHPTQLLQYVRDHPDSDMASGVRWLRLRLTPKKTKDATVIVVTSAGNDEGKSALSLLLADTFGTDGYATVLVNADPGDSGLSGLSASEEFKQSSFRFLDYSNEAMRSLEKRAGLEVSLRERLDTLKQMDVIIIDGPAALTSPEIVEIGTFADRVVLACAWSRTTTAELKICVDTLRQAGVSTSAIAINKVPAKLVRIVRPPMPSKRHIPALPPPSV